MADREIPENVLAFLSKAASLYGRIAEDRFSQDMFCSCVERFESPIEDLFYIACALQCFAEINSFELDPEFDHEARQPVIGHGVSVSPQYKIGNYRVDFLLVNKTHLTERSVVVELDGHEFHDKNKAQRAYEKARDRFLVRSGYRVLHFTGSEVVADPFKVAYEALDLIGAIYYRGGYDEKQPLGDAIEL